MNAGPIFAGAASAAVILAGAIVTGPSRSAQAGPEVLAGPQAQAAASGAASGFAAKSRRTLASLEEELVNLAAPAIRAVTRRIEPKPDLDVQRLRIEEATVAAKAAQLRRETVELALKEYEAVAAKQEKALQEAKLKTAQADEKRVSRRVDQAKDRFAKIKPTLQSSTTDLVLQWSLEADVLAAELELQKVRFLIQMLQSKLKILDEYERPHHLRTLNSDILKARSDELAKNATRNLEQAKLKSMEAAKTRRPRLTAQEQEMLALVERAISLEGKWTTQLDTAEKAGQGIDAVRRELTDLAARFQAVVDEARAAVDVQEWENFKSKIHRLGTRARSGLADPPAQPRATQGAAPVAKAGSFLAQSRQSFRTLRAEITRLGEQVLDDPWAHAPSRAALMDQATSQEVSLKSAEASFENAKLAREVAEIAVKEYEQGIYLQDQATLDGELARAQRDLEAARDSFDIATMRLEAIKTASKGSAEDRAQEALYENRVAAYESREPSARLAVEEAQTKLDLLQQYIKPRRLKELNLEVELARREELAKQVVKEAERSKLMSLQQAIASNRRPDDETHGLAALARAVEMADELQKKMETTNNEAEPAEVIRIGIAAALKELEAAVNTARAERAAAAWAGLKAQVQSIAGQDGGAKSK